MLKDLSRRDLDGFANSKKINPLIFIAASVFAGEILPFPILEIITMAEWNFEKISGVRRFLSIASSYTVGAPLAYQQTNICSLLSTRATQIREGAHGTRSVPAMWFARGPGRPSAYIWAAQENTTYFL